MILTQAQDRQIVYHCTEQVEPRKVFRDGMFDATLWEDTYIKPDTLYLIPHGLGRPVTQYYPVFSDKPVRFPACGKSADGRFLNDANEIGLIFTEGVIMLRMRFC